MARIAWFGPAAVVIALAAPAVAQESGLERAEALVRSGRLQEAVPLVRARLAQAPDDARAQALLGRVLLSVGDPRNEALDLLERAVEAGRRDIPTLLALGHARFAAAGAQRDPSMKRILQVGAKEAFGTAASAARAALEKNTGDRSARKALADALRFQGELLESARAASDLLLQLFADRDAAFANDVAAGLRDAIMRLDDAARRAKGRPLVRALLEADAVRPAEVRHAAVARLYIELLQRDEDWAAIAAEGPALLERFPGDRVLPYTVAVALQHRAVDLPKAQATAMRQRAADIYIAWLKAAREAGEPVTVAHVAFQGSFNLARALIDRGHGQEGQDVLRALFGVLPAGRTRGWVTSSLAIEEKEAGYPDAALAFYRKVTEQDWAEPRSGLQAIHLANLANAWSDTGLVYMGRAHQKGLAASAADLGAARDAFTKAVRYADRAVGMRPGGGAGVHQQAATIAYNFAVYARMNLARLEDRSGNRDRAVELVRAALRYAARHPVPRQRLSATLTLRELLDRWR